MPVYEFRCDICGEKYEQERCIKDRNKVSRCPKCKSKKTTRIPSSTSFMLKGSGWYSTDYKHK